VGGEESRPRSLRLAALLDPPEARRVAREPHYSGFAAASNYVVGYGLFGARGLHRNLPFVGVLPVGRRTQTCRKQ
jgi:hypoxanthine phosphoribosyltransferase